MGLIVAAGEGLDLLAGARLLGAELVAGETQYLRQARPQIARMNMPVMTL